MTKKVARLFEQFQPENYQLKVIPDKEKMVFSGLVTITGRKVGRPSHRITLHQKGLKIVKAKLLKKDKLGEQSFTIGRINSHKGYDELRLHTKEKLFPGNYKIELEFSGKIDDHMHGIYPCYFDNRKKTLIATQFESHHAREVFPCIDEPEAKASFDLTLITPAGETVLANTPVKKLTKEGTKNKTTFETTPLMSSYLLAFVYGDLVFKESETKRGIKVRSYAIPENKSLLDYSVEIAVKCIDFFEDYFGIPYPLPKMDLVALPDFSVGAMENWGLITFRDSVMLTDSKNTSIETKQLVALVVAHEISHQWFGNLVTMKWWDDLWLNESFANLMEYRAIDKLFPNWKILEHFINHEVSAALRRDALENVQAIRTPVRHPDELATLFDPAIAYAKGGAVLNMLRNYIGESAFARGLGNYFKRHQYGNTEAKDLWQSLSEASDAYVGEFMDNWLNKPGFPEILVNYRPGDKDFNLKQRRLIVGSKDSDPASSTLWQVPLAASVKISESILASESSNFSLKSKPNNGLLLNSEGRSYFVPHYINRDHFGQILENIRKASLGTTDRVLLLQQNLLLEQARLVKTTDNLALIESYQNETEESVWSAVAAAASSPRRLVAGDEEPESNLRHFMASLVLPLVNQLGWKTRTIDSPQTLRLRSLALSIAAAAEIPEVLNEAKKRFRLFKKPADLDPEIREPIYFVAAKFGSDRDFDKLVNLYTRIESSDERGEIASGLASVKNVDRIARLLEFIKTDVVRKNVVVSWYAQLLANYYAREQTWQWLISNWQWIEEHFGTDKTYDSFPRYTANIFSTDKEFKKYKEFFGPKEKEVALERTISIGLKEIEARVAWRRLNEKNVKTWLGKNYSTSIKGSTK